MKNLHISSPEPTENMTFAVYKHLLKVYARLPGIWISVILEIIRSLFLRIWVVFLVAKATSYLALGDFENARHTMYIFFLVHVLGDLAGSLADLVGVRTENNTYQTTSYSYYLKLIGKDMRYYRDHQSGYLVGFFRQHLDSIVPLIRHLRMTSVRLIITLTIPVLVMYRANKLLGLSAVGIMLVQILYVSWSSKKVQMYRKLAHKIYRELTGMVADDITNIMAVKSKGSSLGGGSKIKSLINKETDAYWLRRKLLVLFDFPRGILTSIGIGGALLLVIDQASQGKADVGMVVLTVTYMIQIVRNVSEIPDYITAHDELITKIYPTLAILEDTNETIKDPIHPKVFNVTKGEISFENVSFSYYESEKSKRSNSVFKNLSFSISGGEHVGIVGESGVGKSTLASLIMRFDDVTGGAITIDGIDIRDVSQNSLHQVISYVPQEPLLFHQSIRENIAYFNPKASMAEISNAAKAANAENFISALPQKFDSLVGERGVKLSGGQKQRVIIARAILKQASIMIFDEATSALDSHSEAVIQASLPKILGNHTAIVIAHRLSTIAQLDRILVMYQGEIVESGSHQELLSRKGRYYQLWEKQMQSRGRRR